MGESFNKKKFIQLLIHLYEGKRNHQTHMASYFHRIKRISKRLWDAVVRKSRTI